MTRLTHILKPACVAMAVIAALGGCGEIEKDHKTAKQKQYEAWSNTRAGILVQLARQQLDAGDFDKCRQTVQQCIATEPKHEPIYVLAGRLEIESGDIEKAAGYLKTAISLKSDDPESYYYMGICYQRWQNFQSAHDNYQLAWQHKEAEPSYMLAMIEMKISLGQIDDAEKVLLDKLAFFEQTSALRVALAKIETLRGNHAKASQYYRDAILMSPDDPVLRQNYAESIFMSGRYSAAIMVLEEILRDPKVKEKTSARMLLGQSYARVNRLRDARLCFSDLTQANPADVGAWFNLAKTYMQLNEFKQATASSQRILALEPHHVPTLMLLAASQQKMEQWAAAREVLMKASTLSPDNATIFCMIGICHDKLGDRTKAIEAYQRASKIQPQDPWPQELLQAAGQSQASMP